MGIVKLALFLLGFVFLINVDRASATPIFAQWKIERQGDVVMLRAARVDIAVVDRAKSRRYRIRPVWARHDIATGEGDFAISLLFSKSPIFRAVRDVDTRQIASPELPEFLLGAANRGVDSASTVSIPIEIRELGVKASFPVDLNVRAIGTNREIVFTSEIQSIDSHGRKIKFKSYGRASVSNDLRSFDYAHFTTSAETEVCGTFRVSALISVNPEMQMPLSDRQGRSDLSACSPERISSLQNATEAMNALVALNAFSLGERDSNPVPLLAAFVAIRTAIMIDQMSVTIAQAVGIIFDNQQLVDYKGAVGYLHESASLSLCRTEDFAECFGNIAADFAVKKGAGPEAAKAIGEWTNLGATVVGVALGGKGNIAGITNKPGRYIDLNGADKLERVGDAMGAIGSVGDVASQAIAAEYQTLKALEEAGGPSAGYINVVNVNDALNKRDEGLIDLQRQIDLAKSQLGSDLASDGSATASTHPRYQPMFIEDAINESGGPVKIVRACAGGIVVDSTCANPSPARPQSAGILDYVADPFSIFTGGNADFTVLNDLRVGNALPGAPFGFLFPNTLYAIDVQSRSVFQVDYGLRGFNNVISFNLPVNRVYELRSGEIVSNIDRTTGPARLDVYDVIGGITCSVSSVGCVEFNIPGTTASFSQSSVSVPGLPERSAINFGRFRVLGGTSARLRPGLGRRR